MRWLRDYVQIPRSSKGIDGISLGRSPYWLVAGIVFILFFIFILGPGIGPLSGIGD
jgi:hypothetical protein